MTNHHRRLARAFQEEFHRPLRPSLAQGTERWPPRGLLAAFSYTCLASCIICLGIGALASQTCEGAEGARLIAEYRGHRDCVVLENKTTRVTLGSQGGRVLEYSLQGVNAMYLPKGDKGMSAGRFDIGPEQTIPKHPQLWSGPWKTEVTGDRAARLTSVDDKPTGLRVTRDFQLSADSTQLVCKQTLKNISDSQVEYCHWSRTFAHGGGIVIIPTSRPSRFPNHYVMYTPAPLINYRPEDPSIIVESDHIRIQGAPQHPKLGFDSQAGWIACLMKNNLMFVKQFPVYPNRVYNEVAGLTLSVWYPDGPMCELEPIGPRERLAPGQSASFTETWLLYQHVFPPTTESKDVDFDKIKRLATPKHAGTNGSDLDR